jgi:molybdopterin synthase catalytic subunit
MVKEFFMIDQWIKEIKKECPPDILGMILLHNGIVRATAKDGGKVEAMKLSFDKSKLKSNRGQLSPISLFP